MQSERIYRSLHFIDQRRIEVDTNFTMMELVARGKGWTILPPLSLWMVNRKLEDVDFYRFQSKLLVGTLLFTKNRPSLF